jgi:Transposase domain (DUF772)
VSARHKTNCLRPTTFIWITWDETRCTGIWPSTGGSYSAMKTLRFYIVGIMDGRRCPPSVAATVLFLRAYDGVSFVEAIERTKYDLRWKVALGLELEEVPIQKSALQEFQARLVLHEQGEALLKKSIDSLPVSGLAYLLLPLSAWSASLASPTSGLLCPLLTSVFLPDLPR